MIEKIDQTRLDKIRAKTPESLPINPSTSGMSPQAVRRHFYAGMTDENESVVAELNRIVDEVNEEIETINGNADGLDTRLETAESEIDTLQTDMAGAEADITLLGANIQNLGDTVGAIQEKDSEQDNRLTLSESDIAHIEAIINNLELGIVPREIHNAGDMLESISPSLDYRENDNPDNPTLSERLTSWIVTNLGRQPNETDALMVKDIAEPNKDYVHTYFYWEALGTHEAGWRLADIGHAPPPIEQQKIEFTEASTRANIGTGESTATLFGKIKKWYTDLKTHAFTTPSATQSTSADTVPSSKLLRESSFARVYRSFEELDLTATATAEQISAAMVNNSVALLQIISTDALYPNGFGFTGLCEVFIRKAASTTFQGSTKTPNGVSVLTVYGVVRDGDISNKWSGWKQMINDEDAQTITGIKTFATGATPLITDAPTTDLMAVNKAYVDGAISNPSMVVNGDFTRNDSGTASWTSNVYPCVNNWGFALQSGVTGSYTVATKTLKSNIFETAGKYAYLYQYIDNPTRLNGKTVTLSIRAKSTTGVFVAQTWKNRGELPTTLVVATENNKTLFKSASYTCADDEFLPGDTLRFIVQTYGETALDYVKLEIGSLATANIPKIIKDTFNTGVKIVY
jgi:hypothetical protein